MEKKQQRTFAIAGAGIVAAAALGITGATLANAASETGTTSSAVATGSSGSTAAPGGSGTSTDPGPGGGGMRDAGGTLSAEAASMAVSAAAGEVVGGTVNGVSARSDGTYRVAVSKSDGTRVNVLLDAAFAVTSVEEAGMGRGGGRGMPEGDDGGDAPSGGTLPGGGSTGSPDPSDANGTSTSPSTPSPTI